MEADLRAAFDLNERLGRADEISDVCAALAFFLTWSSRTDEAEELVARALSTVGDGDSPARCRLLSRSGLVYGLLGHAKSTLAVADETLGMATRLRIPSLSALMWSDRLSDLLFTNQTDRVVQEVDRALELQ